MEKLNLKGNRFGRWIVLERGPEQGQKSTWMCQCDCGVTKVVRQSSLRAGDSISCGCYAEELKDKYSSKPVGIDSPEYYIWSAMIQRCHNPKASGYKNYGGRGINVCQKWRNSFLEFFNHIGRRPTPTHTLDRIDNDGHYRPGNVRWATRREQNLNTRRTVVRLGS